MNPSLDQTIETLAISLCSKAGKEPFERVKVRPEALMTPSELVAYALRNDHAYQWETYRAAAAMALISANGRDPLSLVQDALTPRDAHGYVSHIGQDEWVATIFNQRAGGYFLDFGAFDGREISNTHYLEQRLAWRGICVEPNATHYPALCFNRRAICINAALWTESRLSLSFVDAHGLSAIQSFAESDVNSERRAKATRAVTTVDTINPTELVDRFNAPKTIDYMSLDVEGAELDVLQAFDFDTYTVALLTVEHNDVEPRRQRMRDYLSRWYHVEGNRNDDFYWRKDFGFPNPPGEVLKHVAATYPISVA